MCVVHLNLTSRKGKALSTLSCVENEGLRKGVKPCFPSIVSGRDHFSTWSPAPCSDRSEVLLAEVHFVFAICLFKQHQGHWLVSVELWFWAQGLPLFVEVSMEIVVVIVVVSAWSWKCKPRFLSVFQDFANCLGICWKTQRTNVEGFVFLSQV